MTSVEKLILAFKSFGVVTAGDLAELAGFHKTRGWTWARTGGEAENAKPGEVSQRAKRRLENIAYEHRIKLKKGIFDND